MVRVLPSSLATSSSTRHNSRFDWRADGRFPKTQTPARGGRRNGPAGEQGLARGLIPGDARDVRADDADIGELAVAEQAQLAKRGVVVLPGLDEADNGEKHDLVPFFPCPAEAGINMDTT